MQALKGLGGFAVVAVLGIAAGCASEPEPLPAPEAEAIVEHDTNTGTVDFFAPNDGQRVLAPGADAAETALAWMDANKDKLGIPDPRASFAPIATIRDDEDGSVAVKLQQQVGGIPIWGVESIVFFDSDGSVISFDGPYIPNLDAIAKAAPAIDAAAAARTADTFARANVAGARTVTPVIEELVVHVRDDYTTPALARHVRADVDIGAAVPIPVEAFVDAMTGNVIDAWVDLHTVTQPAIGLKGIEHSIEVEERDAAWRMQRPAEGRKGPISPLSWSAAGDHAPIRATSAAGPWDPQAVSAFANVATTSGYFSKAHRFAGPDGNGAQLFVYVHYAPKPNLWNAFGGGGLPGRKNQPGSIWFTDGVGNLESMAVALDIVAHEYTHVINSFTSGLGYSREPGAINEALADIFGELVEYDARGDAAKALLQGEDTGLVIRDIAHPSRRSDIDHLSQLKTVPADEPLTEENDQGFVHTNSTIVSNAWALMTVGGVHDFSKIPVARTLGWAKSGKLWWKTLQQVVTRRILMRRLARTQTVSIAQRSKGKFDVRSVACAWYAVGALDESFLSKKLRIRCDGGVADSCAGKSDGIYCSASDREAGYFCKGGELTRVECERGAKCVGPSSDGKVLSCRK